jgi:hypothetical protein
MSMRDPREEAYVTAERRESVGAPAICLAALQEQGRRADNETCCHEKAEHTSSDQGDCCIQKRK